MGFTSHGLGWIRRLVSQGLCTLTTAVKTSQCIWSSKPYCCFD